MSNRTFKDNRLESCTGERMQSKAEYKENIKRSKQRVKKINRTLDVLAKMSSSYDYNQDALVTLVGNATINLSMAKEEVKRMKGRKYGE